MSKRLEESSAARVQKQRAMIESMNHSNEVLKTELTRESRSSRHVTNPAAIKSMTRLQEQADLYAKKIETERRKVEGLDKQIVLIEERLLEQRRRMGGLTASQENNQMIARQIRTLENRLDKALFKFNESLAYNKTLREKIDSMRRERVVFDGIYKRLERELHEKKKEMATIISDSNNAYQARDKARGEMIALRQQAEKDRAEFDAEWKELGDLIETDRKQRDLMRQRQQDKVLEARGAVAMTGDNDPRGLSGLLGTGSSADGWGQMGLGRDFGDRTRDESAQVYEAAFKRIQEATGIENVTDIVSEFLEAEEKNFSMFKFVNDLNLEIERLELSIAETRNDVERHKGQGVSTDTQHRKVLKDLEEHLAHTESKADEYEAHYRDAMKMINQLKVGIQGIWSRVGANHSSTEELLGNQGVSESNMVQYLGLIEQRTSEILQAYAQSQAATLTAGGSQQTVVSATAQLPPPSSGKLAVQLPCLGDLSSGEDSDREDNERPLTRQELKAKTLRSIGARKDGVMSGGKPAAGAFSPSLNAF